MTATYLPEPELRVRVAPDVVRKVTWENASTLFRHPVPDILRLPFPKEH